jgi:hypothetical protein
MPGVYSIPCKHGNVYIRQTGCLIGARAKEHHQHICHNHPEKSVVAENRISVSHQIQLQKTIFLAKKMRQTDQILKEAVEIELLPNGMNREDSLSLSRVWNLLFYDLKEWRQSHAKVSTPSSGLWKG